MTRFRVPATSANLGPGFDCLGLALSIYDEFEIKPADTLALEGVEPRFRSPDNLLVRAYAEGMRAIGLEGSLHASFDCAIPVSRGLGSSAALITAGIAAAGFLHGSALHREQIFALASKMEGHPDNAAPCVYGGLTACLKHSDGTYRMEQLPFSSAIHLTVLIPSVEVSTEAARKILPDSYPRAVAAGNAAHALLMARALETGNFSLLKDAADDQLHEPYRSQLIPGFGKIREIASADTDGVLVISGSGSTCLLMSSRPLSASAAAGIQEIEGGWRIQEAQAAPLGAAYLEEGVWHPII